MDASVSQMFTMGGCCRFIRLIDAPPAARVARYQTISTLSVADYGRFIVFVAFRFYKIEVYNIEQ